MILISRKVTTAAILFANLGFPATGRPEQPLAGYTSAQAEAGRVEIQTNSFGVCTDCHGSSLTGRKGEAGETPALASLSEEFQKTIRSDAGKVPALAGPEFLQRWGARSTKDFAAELDGRFKDFLSDQTRLNIMAFILYKNGARPGTQPLTADTNLEIGKLVNTEQ